MDQFMSSIALGPWLCQDLMDTMESMKRAVAVLEKEAEDFAGGLLSISSFSG